jgi:uncharacterized membrane protein SpoIIM required for sporulation
LDDEVDERGGEARPDSGEGQLEVDTFGRGDPQSILILHTVNLERFVAERRPDWDELDGLVRTARRRAERLGPERVRRLGTLYRAAAADLAFARSRFPGDPVVRRLEDLVGRSRHLVYSAPGGGRGSLIRFFVRDYWRLVAERWIAIVVAIVLLFGPAALAGAWGMRDPAAAIGVLPTDFRDVVEEERPWTDMPPDEQAAFSSAVLTNNIRVTVLSFAGGITLGLLTALVLIYNGILLGAIAGLMIEAGNGTGFVDLVTGHGVLELTCVVVAGAAGLSFGWSIVEPGRGTRTAALRREAVRTIAIILGTAPWLVVAGVVEGFRAELAEAGLTWVIGVGVGLGALYWSLVLLLGRRRAPTAAPVA